MSPDAKELDEQIERISAPRPLVKRWVWVVLWTVVICVIATFLFTGYQLYQQRQDQFKASSAECARRIQSKYEDFRDDIFTNLEDRAATMKAIEAFKQFKEKHGSRAEYTAKAC